ncbi:hypothetical protein KJ359_008893 [Pestalotiopsis sp. 9143b]|nr:hypothetical protein KJ359_008893 [Pestalotiopsis sp. 9143b]
MKFSNLLVDYLHKGGMIFARRLALLGKNSRDAIILRAFRRRGIIVEGEPTTADFARGKKNIEDILVALFVVAAGIDPATDVEEGAILGFESAVKQRVWWADGLSESVFAELLHSLVGARLAWKKAPRFPFDPQNHSPVARQVDQFLEGQQSLDRVRADMAFFEMAGGLVEPEDQDDSENEDEDDKGPSVSGAADEDDGRVPRAADNEGVTRALVPEFSAMELDDQEDGAEEEEEDQQHMMMD